MRVVLDANVLVSGLLSHKGLPGQILDEWLSGNFQLFVSRETLEELLRVLRYPHISERLSQEQTTELLRKIGETAEMVKGTVTLRSY
jgi:putative PIN family toxin of toxin-antitoxin system